METKIKKEKLTSKSKFFKALDELWDLYNLIYSKESNKYFDELHDCIYFQINSFEQIEDYREILESDYIEANQILKEVKSYYKASQKLIMPNWIFG